VFPPSGFTGGLTVVGGVAGRFRGDSAIDRMLDAIYDGARPA
jgi:hypothetical protein